MFSQLLELIRQPLAPSCKLFAGSAALLLVATTAPFSQAAGIAPADIERVLGEAHKQFSAVKDGANADYIPALDEVNSELFSISLVTPDGRVYDVGDSNYTFSIQSISKAFIAAKVIETEGADAMLEQIGVDATGAPFNSIKAIERIDERSVNPLVNAGAMASVSMLKADSPEAKWNLILGTLEEFAGRKLTVMEDIYESEAATNDRNQAIAKLLEAYGRLYDDVDSTVDLYTRQCSVGVTSHDLAVMAGTLASGGTNPVTGKQVVKEDNVPEVLAIMATAGLYDDSGIWLYNVGLPAKSGVGGGIVAVAPGQYGIAAFSPRLDQAGNSVRAQLAIEYIVEQLGGNVFE
ncbi:MAG: glutaminase A [Halioglobus sp.]